MFSLFKEWVYYTLTLKYQSSQNKVSIQTLSTRYSKYLSNTPLASDYFLHLVTLKRSFSGYLLIDGTWFSNRCLVVYKDSLGTIVYWRFADGEYKMQIKQDVEFLVKNGYPLKGIVCDGKQAIVAVGRACRVPVQRCLVHVQRRIQSLLTKRPKTQAGQEFLIFIKHLNQITSLSLVKVYLTWFKRLYIRHKEFLNERSLLEDQSTWWYTHKNTRRAYKHFQKAIPNMFTYLKHVSMPKDTNSLEGFFSQLDNKISIHRGMKQNKKEQLIGWFIYLQIFYKTQLIG